MLGCTSGDQSLTTNTKMGENIEPNYEIEVKHPADHVSLHDFKLLMIELGLRDKFFCAESTDYYYWKNDTFIRHRIGVGKKSEFTVKAKTEEDNNIIRLEENIPIDGTSDIVAKVKNTAKILGLKKSFELFKSAHVYKDEEAIIAYYTIYKDGKASSFIEIEAKEGLSKDRAMQVIEICEKKLAPLGISCDNRVNESLFEMFRS